MLICDLIYALPYTADTQRSESGSEDGWLPNRLLVSKITGKQPAINDKILLLCTCYGVTYTV